MTKKKAIKLGMPEHLYQPFLIMVKQAMKIVKSKPEERE